jgi:hypothetical protein
MYKNTMMNIYLYFSDVDIDQLTSSPKLSHLVLEDNPLTRESESALKSEAVREAEIEVQLSKREGVEEWEDLTI